MRGRRCLLALFLATLWWPVSPAPGADLWALAQQKRDAHRFSTLFPAQSVRDDLATDAGIDAAIDWCKQTAVTKVYLETFRNNYQADAATLAHAKQRMAAAGLEVSGCVAPTNVGKPTTGPRKIRSCYTDLPTQRRAAEIYTFAARHFDEVMIDDFWSTDCECGECDAARRAKTVTVIGGRTFTVDGDTWTDYRLALMRHVTRAAVIDVSKQANPNVRLILKFPNWYDDYHERGYDVIGQASDFPVIWVGNETRNIDNPMHPGIPQYAAYFIQRWFDDIAGERVGGGWYDPHHTEPPVYLEQARQTILGGARESVLFSYKGLREQEHGPADVAILRANIPELFDVATEVRKRKAIGIAAYKPPHSDGGADFHVFDFAGMIGLPLAPCHKFPADAKAALFTLHAKQDADFVKQLAALIERGVPVLLTHNLVRDLDGKSELNRPNVHVLRFEGRARAMLKLPQAELRELRAKMLEPFDTRFDAPAGVALYLFDDGSRVIENFNDAAADAVLNGETKTMPPRQWLYRWKG